MKRILLTGIAIAMIALFAACKVPAEKTSTSSAPPAPAATETGANAEQEVRSLNLEYDKAIVQQDVAAYERLFAEDGLVTETGGKVLNKAQLIANAKSGETKYEVGRTEDLKIRVYGNTAIANGRWVEKSVTKGKSFDGSYMYTTVYVKRDGKWQIVSDQVTPVTP